jgi:aconitate hydratase
LGKYTARPLTVFGDDITTDHISPAGQILGDSDAARWLIERGEDPKDLNVYAARRGNWEVMLRGAFANRSARNLLAPGIPAGSTIHTPSGEVLPIWRAARRYEEEGQPVLIVAGERYGMGSSRDWAAKVVALLGVRAVLATSFERIHRSNLINMGILPLRLPSGQRAGLGLQPGDEIEVSASEDQIAPRKQIEVLIRRPSGEIRAIETTAAIETSLEVSILGSGGILPMILSRVSGKGN